MRLIHKKHKYKVSSGIVVLLDAGVEVGREDLSDDQAASIQTTMKRVGAENLKEKMVAKINWIKTYGEIADYEVKGGIEPQLSITLKYLG